MRIWSSFPELLFQSISLLHEYLRDAYDPRSRSGLRDGSQGDASRIECLGDHGDGDGLSIGGNHLMHAIRRNMDINILMFNNSIYGLTKGQYSPTSPIGHVTKSTPNGSIDNPLSPISIALAAEANLCRSIDRLQYQALGRDVNAGRPNTRGTSFIEIYQNCNVFNDGAWKYMTDKEVKEDNMLVLEKGQSR